MRNIFKILLTASIALFAFQLPVRGQRVSEKHRDGEVYLKVKDYYPIEGNLTSSKIDDYRRQLPFLSSFESAYGIQKAESGFYFAKSEQLRRVFRIYFNKTEMVEELIRALGQLPEVEYVEKVPLLKTTHTPDDLGANLNSPGQYALHLTEAQLAWDIIRGNPGVVVAIVDNAVQENHQDLINNVVAGRDVADGDNDPNPQNPPLDPTDLFDHGTHCAGIAGATSDNGLNVASIGHGISIMPIKATADANDPDFIDNGYEGILWAATNGADVISNSWGGDGCFTCELTIIAAQLFGPVIVAAAGNDNSDTPQFPADYGGVIAVANTTISDMRSGSSNFGSWVDVSAPGTFIQSLVPFNGVGSKSGTSMACPFVAGLIGLAMSARDVYNPGMSDDDVVDCVINTADNIDAQNPTFIGELGSGRVNAYDALRCVCPCPMVYVEPPATYPAGLVRYRQASQEIHSTVVCDGCELTHNSGGFINLTPPFEIKSNGTYWGHIEGCGEGGSNKPSDARNQPTSGNKGKSIAQTAFAVSPNPAVDEFTIRFNIEVESPVNLLLVNAQGQVVRTLISNVNYAKGEFAEKFQTRSLAPGSYFCILQNGARKEVRPLVIMQN